MTIIAAIGEGGAIGREGDLCWHIREDLRHFKQLTTGQAVVMGRATWESLPVKPLPGRRNVVVTSQSDYEAPGAEVAHSLAEAFLMTARDDRELFVIGGASVYRQALPFVRRMEITRIFAADPAADTFFPPYNEEEWQVTEKSEIFTTPSGIKYQFQTLCRK